MNFVYFFLCLLLILILIVLFFLVSNKNRLDKLMSASFECGFSPYFFSRFSFSIHYFMISLIFLFLDLELCLIMPFLCESMSKFNESLYLYLFVLLLLGGLILEWFNDKLDWLD